MSPAIRKSVSHSNTVNKLETNYISENEVELSRVHSRQLF
jgi:hypothetical protein